MQYIGRRSSTAFFLPPFHLPTVHTLPRARCLPPHFPMLDTQRCIMLPQRLPRLRAPNNPHQLAVQASARDTVDGSRTGPKIPEKVTTTTVSPMDSQSSTGQAVKNGIPSGESSGETSCKSEGAAKHPNTKTPAGEPSASPMPWRRETDGLNFIKTATTVSLEGFRSYLAGRRVACVAGNF